MSGRITIDNLSDSLKELINQAGLTEEQVINLINANGLTEEQVINLVKNNLTGDLTQLNTTNKTNIVAAINELFQSANNGKELIANAIGEPLSSNDTFSAMSNDISSLLSQFKTNMMNSGVTVESGDKFKQLIDKIATLADNEGKGIQYASGQITAQQRYTFADIYATHTFNFNKPLNFTPTYLFIRIPDVRYSSTNGSGEAINAIVSNLFNNIYEGNDWANQFRVGCVSSDGVLNIKSVSTTGFVMEGDTNITFGCATSSDYYGTDDVIDWYAIGVGEEDTTLRDSLASILIDEGVSVTEEDDMASLISKVDSEFTRDNNALLEKDNDINELNNQILELESNLNNLTNDNNNTTTKWSNLLKVAGYNINESDSMDDLYNILNASCITTKDVKEISCGIDHTIVIKNDGSIWCCGRNNYGQLGLGDTTNRTKFTKVTANINNDVKQVACGGYHTFILKNDGSVWCSGLNNSGQLGLGNTTNKSTFTQITTNINNDVKQIACGENHTFILKNDGSLWCTGENQNGQLGLSDRDQTDKSTFTQVTTNINNDVKEVICGGNKTFIIKNDGSVWSCGYNYWGELGLGNDTTKYTFAQVTTNINDVKQIACGENHTFILKNDGSLWACGYNGAGNLGLGSKDSNDHNTFVQITTNINNDVKQIACGGSSTFIIKNDGSVWSCGANTYGNLGLNTATTVPTTSFTQVTINVDDVKQIACGENHSFMLKNDSAVWSCGYNNYGQLGLNTTTNVSIFTKRKGFLI